MTSSDDNTAMQPVDEKLANPFVAFRHFADEQMSSLLRSVIGLPSVFHSSSSKFQASADDDFWLQDARELRRHLARESEEAAEIVCIFERAFDDAHKSVQGESRNTPSPYEPAGLEMLYRTKEPPLDPTSPPVVPFHSTPYLFSIFSRSALGRSELGTLPLWPVVYAASSPYSPLWLEHQEPLHTQGNKWRNAFEDLVALQSGNLMPKKDARREYEDGVSWMNSMIERGFFGSRWQVTDGQRQTLQQPLAAATTTATRLPHDVEENEVAELDRYERFLGAQYSSPPSNFAPKNYSQGLISTITTTERNKLPDGSMQTKVVLKKRFSDGREESTETLHTGYDSQQPRPKDMMSDCLAIKGPISQSESKPEVKELKRRGWFWS